VVSGVGGGGSDGSDGESGCPVGGMRETGSATQSRPARAEPRATFRLCYTRHDRAASTIWTFTKADATSLHLSQTRSNFPPRDSSDRRPFHPDVIARLPEAGGCLSHVARMYNGMPKVNREGQPSPEARLGLAGSWIRGERS